MSLGFAKTVVTGDYQTARPFPCAKLDGLIDEVLLERLADDAETLNDRDWTIYDNPLERKLVSSHLPEASFKELAEQIGSDEWLEFMRAMTGIEGLKPDKTNYGAGLSVVKRGGFLELHRDLEIHPVTGLERRLNLVLFLNREWQDEWGGHLEFWSERDGKPYMCGRRIRPSFGRVVIFAPQGFHGFPNPTKCPEGVERLSIQAFYYAPAREGAMRKRAWFVPGPEQSLVAMLNEFRRKAS